MNLIKCINIIYTHIHIYGVSIFCVPFTLYIQVHTFHQQQVLINICARARARILFNLGSRNQFSGGIYIRVYYIYLFIYWCAHNLQCLLCVCVYIICICVRFPVACTERPHVGQVFRMHSYLAQLSSAAAVRRRGEKQWFDACCGGLSDARNAQRPEAEDALCASPDFARSQVFGMRNSARVFGSTAAKRLLFPNIVYVEYIYTINAYISICANDRRDSQTIW